MGVNGTKLSSVTFPCVFNYFLNSVGIPKMPFLIVLYNSLYMQYKIELRCLPFFFCWTIHRLHCTFTSHKWPEIAYGWLTLYNKIKEKITGEKCKKKGRRTSLIIVQKCFVPHMSTSTYNSVSLHCFFVVHRNTLYILRYIRITAAAQNRKG